MEHSAFEDGIFSDFAGPLSPLDGKPLTPTSAAMTSVSHGMHSVMLSLPSAATIMHPGNNADMCTQRLPDCQTLLSAGSPKMDHYKSSTPDYEAKMEYVTKMGCYSPTQKYEYLTGATNGSAQKLEHHQQYSPPPPGVTSNGLQQHHQHKLQMASHHNQHHQPQHHTQHHQPQHQSHHSPSAMLSDYHHHAMHNNGKLEYDPHAHHHQQQQHIAHIYGSPHHNPHHNHEQLINGSNEQHTMSSLASNGLINTSTATLANNTNTDGGLLQPSLGGSTGPSVISTANSQSQNLTSSSTVSSANALNPSPTAGLTNGMKLNKGAKHDDICSPPNNNNGDINTNGVNSVGGSNNNNGTSSVTNNGNNNNNTPPAVKKNDKKKGDPNGIKKKKTR